MDYGKQEHIFKQKVKYDLADKQIMHFEEMSKKQKKCLSLECKDKT